MRLGRARLQRGQALVEMALMLPVLFALTMGIVEGGHAVYAYNAVARAARDGARYGGVYGGSQHPEFNWTLAGNRLGAYPAPTVATYPVDTVVGRVAQSATGLNPDELAVTIGSVENTDEDAGGDANCRPLSPGCSAIQVTVAYTFRPATSFFSDVSFPMTATATAAVE